jgi:RNA-directed DNA polymerase
MPWKVLVVGSVSWFFVNLDRSWLVKFMEHRVADPRILRLIQKSQKAGVMEEGSDSVS